MNDKLEKIWRETVVAWSSYPSVIYLEGLRKIMKDLSRDSRCRDKDLNRASLEYNSRALPLR
jgi:hypothetical protein